MAVTTIFNDISDLEIFSLVTGSICLLLVVFLIIIVANLYISLKKLKKQVALQSRLDQHSYSKPVTQSNEELSVRGFSAFRGQENARAAIAPQKDDYPTNIHSQSQPSAYRAPHTAPITSQRDEYPRHITPQSQPPADRAPHMQGRDEYFGNFGNQPRQGRYAY